MELDLEKEFADRAYPILASLVTPRPIALVTTVTQQAPTLIVGAGAARGISAVRAARAITTSGLGDLAGGDQRGEPSLAPGSLHDGSEVPPTLHQLGADLGLWRSRL